MKFSFNISPSNEHPALVSFRMDWLDLLAVEGTLKSLLQHHSPKESTLRCSAFFMFHLSHPYITTVYYCNLFLVSFAYFRSILFLSFIVPIFAWNSPLVTLSSLKRSLVFPIHMLLFFLILYTKKVVLEIASLLCVLK